MKILALLILFIFSVSANATTYYVSHAGSNSNPGTQISPFATAAKGLSVLVKHDSLLFICNDTWIEQFIIPCDSVYIGSYGTGAKPIITGFQTQTGFTQNGNVWSKTLSSSPGNLRCVLLNNSFAFLARTPNAVYSTYSGSGNDSVIITSLSGSLIGKYIAVRSITWVIEVVKIVNQSGGTLTVYPKLYTANHGSGNGCFLLNDSSYVDALGEYSYDSASKRFSVYSTSAPNVQTSLFDTLIQTNHKKGVIFDGLAFTGGNQLIIKVDTGTVVKNCLIQYAGWDGVQGDGNRDVVIDNDSIMNIYNNGVTNDWILKGTTFTLTNNYIKNVGYVAGMGKNGDGTYMGYLGFPDSEFVEYNRWDSIGYNVIHTGAPHTKIYYNYITNFGFTKQDEAAVYNFGCNCTTDTVRGNIIINGIGNPLGTSTGSGISGNNISVGIYWDDNSSGIYADSNTIVNCKWASVFIHAAPNNNHVFKDNYIEDSVDRPVYSQGSYGSTFTGNIIYSRNPLIDIAYWDNTTQTIDGNYYLRPTLETAAIKMGSSTFYDISNFSVDAHKKVLPGYANTLISKGVLYINPTKRDSVINLNSTKTYIDVKGNLYNDVLILRPYQSILLFESNLIAVPKIYIPQ